VGTDGHHCGDIDMATGMFSGGAAFGVFPQMQPRRRLQDPEGSANVPLDFTRGRFAGVAGLLPDVLNFMGRSPMPTEMFGDTQYEPTQQLPYGSEYYLENLPLKPTSRIGEVAGQAGAFVPLNPMPAARAVAAGAKALGPTAVRMGEGYLQSRGLMPGVVEGESAGMLGGPIKPQAPVSPIGFYSAAEQAALALPRKSGTGDAFLNDLMKGQDVKKDEISWMGLDDYLKGKPNVTRQEVQDYIAGNRVDVQEVRLGGNEAPSQDLLNWMSARRILPPRNPEGWQELSQRLESFAQQHQAAGGDAQRTFTLSEEAGRISEGLNAGGSSAGATKYERYQLPGGENYREILLTLPANSSKAEQTYIRLGDLTRPLTESELLEYRNARDAFKKETVENSKTYRSSHFNEPNILAHMRVNDRIDADGKKMLLIEEVQSDWHQAGREKGYKTKLTPEQNQEMQALLQKNADEDGLLQTDNARLTELIDLENAGVPDAPFKGTWHQLALKRALKYAADNGYDRVGLTTGSQQAERYDLSKQISKVMWDKETGRLTAYDKNVTGRRSDGRTVVDESGVTESKLSDYIGKEAAQKLIKESPDEEGVRFLSGLDLQIGGEGMKKYYDEIYPAFFAKQGKKYNAKTGETRIKTGKNLQDEDFVGAEQRISEALGDYGERGYKTTDNRFFDTYADAVSHEKKISSKDPFDAPIRYIDISPEMRGGVKKGQPLFTAAPIGGIGLGAGTQDNEMPDAVRQYMADPRYSDPFADTTR